MPASEALIPPAETESQLLLKNPSSPTSSSSVQDNASTVSPLVWMESLSEMFSPSTIPNTQTEVKVSPKPPVPPATSPPPKESLTNVSPPLESNQAISKPQLPQENPTDTVTDVFKSLFGLTRNETSSLPSLNVDQVPKAKSSTEQKKNVQETEKKPDLISAKQQNDPVTGTFKTLLGLGRPEAKSTYNNNNNNSATATGKKETIDKQKKQKSATLRLEPPKKRGEKKSIAAATQQEKQVTAVLNAKSGATIRLFDFFVGRDDDEIEDTNQRQTIEPPKGVPVLSKWKKNLDGSVSGIITGSKTFNDGEAITTSPLKGDASPGSVVTTQSGSRYVLLFTSLDLSSPSLLIRHLCCFKTFSFCHRPTQILFEGEVWFFFVWDGDTSFFSWFGRRAS